MPRLCALSGCVNSKKSSVLEKTVFFQPISPENCEKWKTSLLCSKLTKKSYICYLHFNAEHVVRFDRHLINGEEVLLPRKKWGLKPGALPRPSPVSDNDTPANHHSNNKTGITS
jgi:hypothetical protein